MSKKEDNSRNFLGVAYQVEGAILSDQGEFAENICKYVRVLKEATMSTFHTYNDVVMQGKYSQASDIATDFYKKVATVIAEHGFYDGKECYDELSKLLESHTIGKIDMIQVQYFWYRILQEIKHKAFAEICNSNGVKMKDLVSYKGFDRSVEVKQYYYTNEEEHKKVLNIIDNKSTEENDSKGQNVQISPEELKRQKEAEEAQQAKIEAEKAEAKRLEAEKSAIEEEKRLQAEKAIEEEKRQTGIAKINERIFRIRKDMKDVEAFGLLVEGYDEFEKILKGEEVKSHFNDDQIAKCENALKTAENSLENTIESYSEKPFCSFTRPDCHSKFQYVEMYPAIN